MLYALYVHSDKRLEYSQDLVLEVRSLVTLVFIFVKKSRCCSQKLKYVVCPLVLRSRSWGTSLASHKPMKSALFSEFSLLALEKFEFQVSK